MKWMCWRTTYKGIMDSIKPYPNYKGTYIEVSCEWDVGKEESLVLNLCRPIMFSRILFFLVKFSPILMVKEGLTYIWMDVYFHCLTFSWRGWNLHRPWPAQVRMWDVRSTRTTFWTSRWQRVLRNVVSDVKTTPNVNF